MAALSSCAVTQGGSEFIALGCVDDAEERLDGVDWESAWTVNLRIRQGEFNPMVVNMVENGPIVLRIINDDDSRHTVRSSEFFRSIALESIAIGAEIDRDRCIDAVTVPARATAELRLMPVRYGRYDFEDSSILVSRIAIASAVGVFVIEPYKSYYIEPIPQSPPKIPEAEPVSAPPVAAPNIFNNEPGVDEPILLDEPETTKSEDGLKPAPSKPTPPQAKKAESDNNIVIFDDPEEFQ